ncbi:hypothetical protein ACFQ14_08905 [Pseudahrensia aquimaris]|uniref:Type I secretion protein n=1 Tax=Pseudahrensia aquimaris TaxID=744461 RepID=A0ABW3FDH6_9HYPH
MDHITETIAHFIGVFSIQLERARMREEYDEFPLWKPPLPDAAPITQVTVTVLADYDLRGMKPNVDYEYEWPEYPYFSEDQFKLSPIFSPSPAPLSDAAALTPAPYPFGDVFVGRPSAVGGPYDLDPAGSVAIVIGQNTALLDRDVLSNAPVDFDPISYDSFEHQLDFLTSQANTLVPLSVDDNLANEDAIMQKIEHAAEALKALHAEGEAEPPETSEGALHLGGAAKGFHSNGQAGDALTSFNLAIEHHQPEDAAETNPPATDPATQPQLNGSSAGASQEGGYTASAGKNEMSNQAVLQDAWTDAPVMAVMGNYTSLQIVMQTNVWQNNDYGAFTHAVEDLAMNTAGITVASAPIPAMTGETSGTPDFPENWGIARLETNLVSFNWLEQFNTVYDEDIISWEHQGSELMLQMGDNLSTNLVSLFELGLQYDLIIVSGSVFAANIIDQRNILLDDDRLAGDDGSSILSSGNVLWNGAQIHTIGQTSFEALPSAYLEAASNLQDGGSDLTKSIFRDDHFAGNDFLSVLYIEGDLIDLNYIRQTNVLSDADQIQFAGGLTDGDSGFEAGGNLLANLATIIDYGTDTTAYVGGEIYSDALLHQANFVETEAPLAPIGSSQLASEAVLFLADDMIGMTSEEDENFICATASAETNTVDVMQSVTG